MSIGRPISYLAISSTARRSLLLIRNIYTRRDATPLDYAVMFCPPLICNCSIRPRSSNVQARRRFKRLKAILRCGRVGRVGRIGRVDRLLKKSGRLRTSRGAARPGSTSAGPLVTARRWREPFLATFFP